jgi:hypothetical protein
MRSKSSDLFAWIESEKDSGGDAKVGAEGE